MYEQFIDGERNIEFRQGAEAFINFAMCHPSPIDEGHIKCPCARCQNTIFMLDHEVLYHLLMHGFVSDHYCWRLHRENLYNPEPVWDGHLHNLGETETTSSSEAIPSIVIDQLL